MIASAPWPTTTLSDSERFQLMSGLWKGKKPPFAAATVVRNTNFAELGSLDLSDVAVLDVEERQLAQRRLREGDLIIERSGGGPKQPVGRVCYFDRKDPGPYSFSNFTAAIRVRDRAAFAPRFLAYWLLYVYQSGATIPLQRATTGLRNLDWGAYTELPIARPPIDEQAHIAATLALVQRAVETEERAVAATRALKRSAMARVFSMGLGNGPVVETGFGPLAEHWPVRPLGECSTVQSGVAKGRRIPPDESVDVPYLRVANVQDGRLELADMKNITIRRDEVQKYSLRDGDVVLTEGGDLDKLGRGFIWRSELPVCVHQNHIFAVRPDPKRLMPEFLAYLVQSPYGRSYFLSVAHKTTNLASINLTKLKGLPVPLPALAEQVQITAVLSLVDHALAARQRRASVLRELFMCLLDRLMTGEIRVDQLDIDTSQVAAA